MPRLVLALSTLILTAALLVATPPAAADTFVLQTDMYGSQQTPPVETRAYGFVRFFFNDSRTAADYTVDVKGLATGLVLGADIHRGAPGETGPVVKKLAEGGFIVTSGRLRLDDDDLRDMANGLWYVSLKSVDNPDGEMRGQIVLPAGFLPPEFELTVAPQPEVVSPAEEAPDEAPAEVEASGAISPPEGFDEFDASEHPPVVNPPAPEPEDASPPPAAVVLRPPNTGDAGLR